MSSENYRKKSPQPHAATQQKIAIVGAGIAGLTAAYKILEPFERQVEQQIEADVRKQIANQNDAAAQDDLREKLMQEKAPALRALIFPEITIYEASNRLGGRIKTTTTKDGYIEEGAELIDSAHTELHQLAKAIGVKTNTLEHPPTTAYYMGSLTNHWQKLSPKSVLEHDGNKALLAALKRDCNLCRTMRPTPGKRALSKNPLYVKNQWEQYRQWSQTAKNFDRTSLSDYLDHLQKTTRADAELVALIKHAYESELGRPASEISALALIENFDEKKNLPNDGFYVYGKSDEAIRIEGGTQAIIDALEAWLKERKVRFQMGYTLEHIAQSDSTSWPGPTLGFAAYNEKTESLSRGNIGCDAAIITLPIPNLVDIGGIQQLLDEKQWELMNHITYGAHKKIIIPLKESFISPADSMITDSPWLQHCWIGQYGEQKAVTFFIANAPEYIKDDTLIKSCKTSFAQMIGEPVDAVFDTQKQATTATWPASYICPSPGDYRKLETLATPAMDGRIQFAGEAFDRQFNGFMGAAICSARRAAKQVIDTLALVPERASSRADSAGPARA